MHVNENCIDTLLYLNLLSPSPRFCCFFGIFKSACVTNGEVDYVLIWIVCGIPFGLYRMYFWITPHTSSVSGFISQCTAILLLGGVSGGFFLAWRLIIALLYVPVTVFRFLFLCEGSIMNRIQTTCIINNV